MWHPGLNPFHRCCLQHGAGKLAQEGRGKLTQKYRGKEEWLCPGSNGSQGGSGVNCPCPTCCCPPLQLVGAAGSSWLVQNPANLAGNSLCARELPLVWGRWGSGPRHVLCLDWWWGPAGDAPAFGPSHISCTNWVSSLSLPASFPSPALPKLVFWPRITPAALKGATQMSPRRDRVKISIFCESPVELGSRGSGGGAPLGIPSTPLPSSPAIMSQPGIHPQPHPPW